MPPLEEGNLWIRALLPRTVTLQEAARMAPRLRKVIASVPEIRAVMSHVGRPDDGTDVTSYFNLEFNAPLIPMEQWRKTPVTFLGHRLWDRTITREEIQDELTEKFEAFPSINFNFSQLIRDNVEEALSGVKGANSIKLFGNDLNVLETEGQRVVNILNTVPGIKNAGLFHIIGQPNLEIQIDRHECARYGINVSDVEAVVQVAVGGRAFTQMVEGEKRFDIVLRLPRDQRDDPGGHRPDPGRHARGRRQARGSDPARSARQDRPSQAGCGLHLPREQPSLHPDQVQRAGPRPGLDDRGGPAQGERPQGGRPSQPRATTSSGRANSPRWSRPTPGCSGSCRCPSA